ncbi:MAG: peptide chain release factor N(5)-glutamine methyltransferase [Christensenellales bacterium]
MTVREWEQAARARLSSTPDARAEAIWIIEECLRIPRAQLPLFANRTLAGDELRALEHALSRRMAGEPIQYIFSRAPFMGFEFFVDRRVLIPRMDTEVLCDAARGYIQSKNRVRALDLCAGSGAIGISLKRLCPQIDMTLSDISPGAGAVQKINAAGEDIEILTGDLFEPVINRTFDLITCNPPYVRAGEIAGLPREVRAEPVLALDGGADGLSFYRRLAREYRKYLAPGGRMYLEVGSDQADDVRALLGGGDVICDLHGVQRVVWTEV